MKNLNIAIVVTFGIFSSVLSSPPPLCPSEPHTLVFFPDSDCTKFWQCSNGVAYLMSCPPTLHWNQKFSICDWRESADCHGDSSSTFKPQSSTTPRPHPTRPSADPVTETTTKITTSTQTSSTASTTASPTITPTQTSTTAEITTSPTTIKTTTTTRPTTITTTTTTSTPTTATPTTTTSRPTTTSTTRRPTTTKTTTTTRRSTTKTTRSTTTRRPWTTRSTTTTTQRPGNDCPDWWWWKPWWCRHRSDPKKAEANLTLAADNSI